MFLKILKSKPRLVRLHEDLDVRSTNSSICYVTSRSGSFAIVPTSLLGHGVTGVCYNFDRYSTGWRPSQRLTNSFQMVSIAQPYYALHSTSQLKWTATQEKTLSREYPFVDLHAETPELYVQRTYLQFLWLPEVRVLQHNFVSPAN